MLQEEDQRLSHWAESREERSLPGPGLHPVPWWEYKGAGVVPSSQPSPRQQRPAGVHSKILIHLPKNKCGYYFWCYFMYVLSKEYYTTFPGRKGKNRPKKKTTPQTLINKSCVFGMALSIRVKISTGLDRVCLPHNETSWVCTKLKFTDNSLSYCCLFQFTNILIKKRVIFCVCYIFSFSLNFLPLTIF